MPYVFSTSSASVDYVMYKPTLKGQHNIPDKKVTIKGGSNVFNGMYTPRGVATKVTDDELEFLKNNPVFKQHLDAGFLTISDKEKDPEVVLPDMKFQDASAPKTEESIAEDNAKLSGAKLRK
jgi:hypothetical protein